MGSFKKSERKKAKIKMAFLSPSGGGKTFSSLLVAQGLGEKVAMIDTENHSGELYSNLYDWDHAPIDPPFEPQKYIDLIKEAEREGYEVLIIDSLSHAWSGEGGLLDMKDKYTQASDSKNSYFAWRQVTPVHNRLVDTILQSEMHIIVCIRTKTAYEVQDVNGKQKPVKIGLSPVFREGVDYEFTLVFDLGVENHYATVSKDRTSLFDGQTPFVPTVETGQTIRDWLEKGKERQMTQRQRLDLFSMMQENKVTDSKGFFDFVLEDREMTFEWAKAFIRNFESHLERWQEESEKEPADSHEKAA